MLPFSITADVIHYGDVADFRASVDDARAVCCRCGQVTSADIALYTMLCR